MEQRLLRTTWLGIFGAIVVVPALAYLAMPGSGALSSGMAGYGRSMPDGMWHRLCTLTGLLALSALVCAAVLPSRLRSLNRAFGIESVIDLHRFFGVGTAAMVFAHLACVVAADPSNVALLDLLRARGAAQAATVATLALVAMALLAELRRRTQLSYEAWKWSHLVLAAVVLAGAALHVVWLDRLLRDATVGALFALLAALVAVVLGYRWVWRPLCDPSTEFVVQEVRHETKTASTLVLAPRTRIGRAPATWEPADWEPADWEFAPGQFAWLRLSRSAVAEEHPFTIASSAHADAIEFTIRHTGDFTRALRRLAPGAGVWVDGPHGAFTNERHVGDIQAPTGFVMIAGGVGITPMMSMLRTAAHRLDPRPYRLVVATSSPEERLFRAELGRLRRHLDLTVTEVLRRPVPGWSGHTGEIGVELLGVVHDGIDPVGVDYFVCGPPSLVTDALSVLDVIGVPHTRVHTEQFDLA